MQTKGVGAHVFHVSPKGEVVLDHIGDILSDGAHAAPCG
jgi:hypothetical protein